MIEFFEGEGLRTALRVDAALVQFRDDIGFLQGEAVGGEVVQQHLAPLGKGGSGDFKKSFFVPDERGRQRREAEDGGRHFWRRL